ncbi:MAG: hypothetical protein ACOYB1_18505 [Limnohabitans sp.]
MSKVKKILSALQEHLNIKNYQLLANCFGVKQTTIYSWIKHDKIAGTGKILGKFPYINAQWLETGEGPMFAEESPPVQPARKRLVATLEQGYGTRPVEKPKDAIDMPEMVKMTMVVLDSESVYRSALAANVRAFYQAVINEGEMQSLSDKMELMQAQMARMETLLSSLNAALPQKREETEGEDNFDPGLQSAK